MRRTTLLTDRLPHWLKPDNRLCQYLIGFLYPILETVITSEDSHIEVARDGPRKSGEICAPVPIRTRCKIAICFLSCIITTKILNANIDLGIENRTDAWSGLTYYHWPSFNDHRMTLSYVSLHKWLSVHMGNPCSSWYGPPGAWSIPTIIEAVSKARPCHSRHATNEIG